MATTTVLGRYATPNHDAIFARLADGSWARVPPAIWGEVSPATLVPIDRAWAERGVETGHLGPVIADVALTRRLNEILAAAV
jgi:hypothetical protein